MCKMILKLCFRNLDAKERIDWLVGWLTEARRKLAGSRLPAGDSFKGMERSGRIEQDFSTPKPSWQVFPEPGVSGNRLTTGGFWARADYDTCPLSPKWAFKTKSDLSSDTGGLVKFPNLACPHSRSLCCFESLGSFARQGGMEKSFYSSETLWRHRCCGWLAVKAHRSISEEWWQVLLCRLLVPPALARGEGGGGTEKVDRWGLKHAHRAGGAVGGSSIRGKEI